MKLSIGKRILGRVLTEFFEAQQKSEHMYKFFKFLLNFSKTHQEYSSFIAFKKTYPKMNYSQLDQDLFCLYESSKGEIPKTFCEIGVGDGVVISNTYLLELEGWHGLLVEPNPIFHNSIKNKRLATLDKRAVSVVTGEGKIEFNRKPLLSKVIFAPNDDLHELDSKIQLVSINEILAIIGNEIGFLSLDIEGNEDLIIESLDFSNFKPYVVCVEHNYNLDKMTKIQLCLEKNGYKLKFKYLSRFDYWFIKLG